jgi:5-methylcytosine-specific restriction endonuclease McrA
MGVVGVSRKASSWRKRAFARVVARDGAVCAVCGSADSFMVRKAGTWGSFHEGDLYTRVNITSRLELEHTVPLSEGGTNDDSNLKLVCHDCHKIKTTSERSRRLKPMFAEWRAAL